MALQFSKLRQFPIKIFLKNLGVLYLISFIGLPLGFLTAKKTGWVSYNIHSSFSLYIGAIKLKYRTAAENTMCDDIIFFHYIWLSRTAFAISFKGLKITQIFLSHQRNFKVQLSLAFRGCYFLDKFWSLTTKTAILGLN